MAVTITSETKYFDGQSSKVHKVRVELSGSILYVTSIETGDQILAWSLNSIYVHEKPMPPQAGMLSHTKNPDARLHINSEKGWNYIVSRLPKSARGGRQLPIHFASFFGYGVIAVASVVFLFAVLPNIIASFAYLIPNTWQQTLGKTAIEAMVGNDKTCTSPDGLKVLTDLTERIEKQLTRDIEYKVKVINNDFTYNAFAAPGGYVIIYKDIIRKAKSPEEVAGVLAHEMSHVDLHHAIKGVVRDLGFRAVLSLALGGTGGVEDLAGFFNQMSYSRKYESEADMHAKEALIRAGINPLGLQDFLGRLKELEESIGLDFKGSEYLEYFSTHPNTAKRFDAIKPQSDEEKNRQYERALTKEEWNALRTICDQTETTIIE